MGSKILPLIGARLSSQTLVVIRKRMGYQTFSNKVVGIDGAKTCGSYECQVRF